MNKWNRNWKLIYTIPLVKEDGSIDTEKVESYTIGYPLKIDFNITRNTFSDSNKAILKLYNLNQGTRDAIFQDYINIDRWCFVELYAGYQNKDSDALPLILKGKVFSAYSEDNGTDIITKIEVVDNSILESFSSHTFEAGTPLQEVYDTIAKDMQFIQVGSTGKHVGELKRPLTINGNPMEELNTLTGGHNFIDNGRLNILYDNEVLGDYGIYKITSDTGLLGMPRRKDAQIEIDCLFSPEIAVGQLVDISSSKDPLHFDGQYKVVGLSHNGSISGADSGSVRTTLNLFAGTQLPNSNFVFTQITSQPVMSVKGEEKENIDDSKISKNVKDVYDYIIKNGKPPASNATKDITWKSILNYNNLVKAGMWTIPGINVLSNLYAVASKVQKFVDNNFSGSKITITSGWRPSAYNRKIKGATKSQHIVGKALDFKINGHSNKIVGNKLAYNWKYGFTKSYSTWQHADVRGLKGLANDK